MTLFCVPDTRVAEKSQFVTIHGTFKLMNVVPSVLVNLGAWLINSCKGPAIIGCRGRLVPPVQVSPVVWLMNNAL